MNIEGQQRSQRDVQSRTGTTLRSLRRALGRCLPYRLRENLGQWLRRAVHEPDFELFDLLRDEPGLFLDVGANRGQAAISVLRRTRYFRVISLEPNPALRWSLLGIWLLHPRRFRFRMIGADHANGEALLRVPRGATDLTAQASLDRAEFDKDYVRKRLALDGHVAGSYEEFAVRLRRLDELSYAPDIVKIDVEGSERRVLEGMAVMLSRARPALIIELNNRERWAAQLQELGYRLFTFESGRLHEHGDWRTIPGLNVICLHPQCTSPVSRRWCRLARLSP